MARRLLLVAVLFAVIVGASWLVPDHHALASPLALATYGFLVIAAFTAGQLFERLSIPRVTAYLLTGLVAGPFVTQLVDPGMLGATHHFQPHAPFAPLTILALTVVGLRAGAALRLPTGAAHRRALTVALLATTLAVLVGVGLAVIAVVRFRLLPAGALQGMDLTDLMLASTLAASVALGGGATATVAVLDESGAVGPVARGAHALTVAREAAAVLLTAALFALTAGGAEPHHAFVGLALSVVAGLAVAGVTLAVHRLLRREAAILSLAALVFMTAGLSYLAHASAPLGLPWRVAYGPLVALLVAGFALSRAGEAGRVVLSPLAPLATPVYVLFFVAAGASFPLHRAVSVVPLAAVLFLARAASLAVAGRAVSELGPEDDSPAFRAAGLATVGSFPAMGVSVGLSLWMTSMGPAWARSLGEGLLGAVLLSEAVGPFILRALLRHAGELVTPDEDDDHRAAALRLLQRDVADSFDLPTPPETLPPALLEPLDALREGLQAEMEDFTEAVAVALASGPFAFVRDLSRASEDRDEALTQWATRASEFLADGATIEALDRLIKGLLQRVDAAVAQLRPVSVPETPADRAPRPGDGRLARAHKAWLRALAVLGLRRRARRVVRLDRLALTALSGPLPGALTPVANLALRAPAMALDEVRRAVLSHERPVEAGRVAPTNLLRLGDEVLARTILLFGDAMTRLYEVAERAGTPSLPERRTRPARVLRRRAEDLAALADQAQRWDAVTRALGTRLLVVIEAERLDGLVAAAFHAASEEMGEPLARVLVPPLATLGEAVETTRAQVVALLEAADREDPPTEALREAAEALRAEVDRHLAALDQRLTATPLDAPIETLRATLERCVTALPHAMEVGREVVELPEEGLAPPRGVGATEPLAVQEVARAVLVDGTAGRLVEAADRVDELTAAAREALGHARSLERFHLGAAADELAAASAAEAAEARAASRALARELAEGGLTRLSRRLAEQRHELAQGAQELAQRLRDTGAETRERLRALLTHATPAEARAATRDAAAGSRPLGGRERARAWVAAHVRPLLPLPARGDGGAPWAEASLAGADAASVQALAPPVPPAYLRLFTTNPLGVDEFHVGRERELEALAEAAARFRSGRPSSVLVLAPPGGGARSFIERALRGPLRDLAAARVTLTRRVTTDRALVGAIGAALGRGRMTSPRRLIEHLRALPARSVLTLGPLGRAHLRTPDGLGALRLLRRLVGETGDRVLWVVASDEVTARSIEAVVPLRAGFTHTLPLPPLSVEEVAALVERRHRASGYRLRFEAGATRLGKGLAGPGAERERLFEELRERSEGVPLRVVFEWLRSVEYEGAGQADSGQADSETIVARPAPPLGLGFLDALGLDELVLAAQLHVHAGLTTEEAARVLRVLPDDADAALRGLAWRSVAHRSPVGLYQLNPLLWGALRVRLRDRGIA